MTHDNYDIDKDRIRQCPNPQGQLGLEVAKQMNQRHEPLWRWGLEHVTLPANPAILDLGCGGGRSMAITASLWPDAKITGLDFSLDMVSMARQTNAEAIAAGRAEVLHASVSALPFDDNTFDFAVAFETLYFWPDIPADMREVCRVLKPGGIFLVVNELYQCDRLSEKSIKCTEIIDMKLHTPAEMAALLADAGFGNIKTFEHEEDTWLTGYGEKA